MDTLVGHYDERVHARPAVGLIVLQSDVVMEHELRSWLPDEVPLLHTRIFNDITVSADTLTAMAARLPAAVAMLPEGVQYGVIVYGCTSASTLIGEARVAELVHSVLPGVAVTNPLTAVKAWLRARGLSRIGLLTPYVPSVSQAIIECLRQADVVVAHAATFNEPDDRRVARLSAQAVRDAMVDLGRREECDAVFGSCTNLRALALLDDVERLTGKPAITSNAALAWHIQSLMNNS